MSLIPVNSLQTADGQLVSLSALRGSSDAKAIPLDQGQQIVNVAVSSSAVQLSISLAATLGIGTIFAGSGSLKAREVAYWQDATAFADSPVQPPGANIVTQTRWGFGLRVFFRVQQLDASFKLTYATIGAGVQYGKLVASYEVQTLGLGPQALPAILDGMTQFGELTTDTIRDLNGKVLTNLISLLAAPPPGGFTPRPLAVQVTIPAVFDPIVKARDEVFAMRRIREGSSLNAAIQQAGNNHSADVIKSVYDLVVGNQPPNTPPPSSAVAFAKTWLG